MSRASMRKRVFLVAGLALLCAAGVWHFGLSHRWAQRLTPGWRWESNVIGTMTFADAATGRLPEKDTVGVFERALYVKSDAERPRSVLLEDSFVIRDPNTGQVTWEYNFRAPVDPATGAYTQPEYAGDIYVFPRGVEKKTYRFRYNYLEGVPLSFRGEEEVEGVETYVFGYRGRAEYTESYAGTAQFPGVAVEPGQEIKCADDQFAIRVWVEPATGEMLKLEESCHSGDYVYDTATGQPVAAIARWDGVTSGRDLINRARAIRRERAKYLWATRYLPATLLASGLLCVGFALLTKKSRGGER